MQLGELIRSKRSIICVGSGGVGKTTVSAAIALHAAHLGSRALALTVDPARRLASALGLETFHEEEQRVDGELLERAGIELKGSLDAAMLDTKSTFDRVVARYAPSSEVRDRILSNPFYRHASTALAGSQEYMAMEKLFELREDRADHHDLVVLDTPPSRHVLDFLAAPSRLTGLFEHRAFRLFMSSVRGKKGRRPGFGRIGWILRGMGRFLGTSVFLDVLDFLESFSSMYEGFVERSRKVEASFRAKDVAFLVVTSPDAVAVDEALYLHRALVERDVPFAAFVVNRAHVPPVDEREIGSLEERLAAGIQATGRARDSVAHDVARRAAGHIESLQRLAHQDARAVEGLVEAAGADRVIRVPHFPYDIHSVADLHRFATALAARPPETGPAALPPA